jgi:hypothetical protein
MKRRKMGRREGEKEERGKGGKEERGKRGKGGVILNEKEGK